MWVAVPYNNFALNNSFVSDGYLPEIVILTITLLVLVLNPLLRRFAPWMQVRYEQRILLVGMLLFAAVIPSNGLYRFFPHCLALNTQAINKAPKLAQAMADSDLPAALFPDPLGPGKPTPVSDAMMDELAEGEALPWGAWLAPGISWGILIIGSWCMMIGLALMVFPQWRKVERVSFPLLRVYHALVDEPEKEEHLLPPALRSRLFWFGAGLVLLLHSLNGMAIVTGGAVPTFPFQWNVASAFSDGIWAYAPGFLRNGRIYFLFIGLAYFMPSRYSFSVWFTVFAAGLLVMGTRAYMPWFVPTRMYDVGAGALVVISIGILYLGRAHYLRVLLSLFGGGDSEEGRTNALAGRLFVGGCLVMFLWYTWAGAGAGFALLFVAVVVMVMLLVSRIVSETGITYVWIIPLTTSKLVGLFPTSWISVSTAFLQEANYIIANRASAVSVAVMTIITLGLRHNPKPRHARRSALMGLSVLLLGFVVCGAVHLHMGYTLPSSYDGKQTPVTGRGARLMGLTPAKNLVANRTNTAWADELEAVAVGVVIGSVLLFLCARFPWWPLHPIGLIFVHSSIGLRLVMSLLFGWALRSLILHYFGARAFRSAMPFFLGLILGEILANAIWTLVPVLQIVFGANPGEVEHLVIFQYT